jgi:hypothetical protein
MPTGDGVQKRPTLEQEVAKFTGFTTQEGEIVDPKAENLNPTAQNISPQERQAGTKTVEEAATEEDTDAENKPVKSAETAANEPAKDDKEADNEADAATEESDDDTKTITVAEAKKMAKAAAGKRIGDLTREKRALERRLQTERDRSDSIERRLDAIEGLTPEKKANTSDADKAPDPAAFEYGEMDPKFIGALAEFKAEQKFKSLQKAENDNRQREAAARQEREFATKKTALEAAGEKEYDDFHEVVVESAEWSLQNQDAPEAWPLSAVVGELAFDSKIGHKVLYHLATHQEEARKVFAMSPGAQGAWFARKEQEFSPPPASDAPAKPAAKTSKAPPPPKHNARGGNGRNPVSTDSGDFAAVEAQWRNQGRAN